MSNNAEIDKSATAEVHGLRLSLMGSEGSGKTCFFAGLAWLGSAAQKSNFVIKGRNERSQTFVSELRDTLARNELPQSTRKTDDLALDVLYRGSRIGINIENFAGEEFRAVGTELREDSPLFARFLESRYLVLFLDIENDVDRDSGTSAERLDAVLTLLADERLCDGSRKLAVVLTKADLRGITKENATSSAASKYLQTHQPGLFGKIEELGYEKEFFFLAPIGRSSLADGQPPAPFGFEALFNWLVGDIRDELFRTRILRHKIPLLIIGAVLVLAAGIGLNRFVHKLQANSVLNGIIPSPTSEEAAKALKKGGQQSKDGYIDREMGKVREELPSVDSLSALDALQVKVAQWKGQGTESVEKRLSELENKLREKREDIHLNRIFALESQNIIDCRNAIATYYLDTNTARRRDAEIRQVSTRLDNADRNRKRAEIRAANVVSGRLDTLKSRCDLIAQYPFPDQISRTEAERAVAIGRLMLADSPYRVEIKSAKGLSEAYRTRLELSNLDPSTLQQEETTHQKSRNPQWNKKVEFRWKPTDKIKVEWLWSSHWGPNDTIIGTREFKDPWTALIDILGGVQLTPETGPFHANLEDTPQATIICEEFPNPKKDLALFKKYIVPGTYWQ